MYGSAAELIDAKGKATAFAEKVGKPSGVVRQWKFRGVIPRDAWPEILKAFDDVKLDDLLQIERRARDREASSHNDETSPEKEEV